MAGPVGVNKLAWFGEKLIGVCTEVVPLGLDQVGWYTRRSTITKKIRSENGRDRAS